MKQILRSIVVLLSVILTACGPELPPTETPAATPTQWFPPTATPTAMLTETPATTEATPTLNTRATPGVDAVIDCAAVYPGLPGCLQEESLVGGRLAFVDKRPHFNRRPTIVDLKQGDVHILGEEHDGLRGWSPFGTFLLTGRGVYRYDGKLILSPEQLHPAASVSWAPRGAFSEERDWLIWLTGDGGLEARALPDGDVKHLLPPETLAPNGRDTVLLSGNGQLAWTPSMDSLVEADRWAQELHIQPLDGDSAPTILPLSDDIRETYYSIVGWVPGTRSTLAGRGLLAVSLWVDGVPLVTIDADTGEITELGVTMLLTSEAYAWHPTQPGLLALAAGGSRFINENKRLALLDVTTGDLTYLTSEDKAAFAPSWSPDGKLLAYAVVPASPGASGDGETMERTLKGRAIYIVDPATGERRALTEPGEAIDGWPQWSADGKCLLYTRQQEGHTDVRVVALDDSKDDLLLTGLADDPGCYYSGCAWDWMLAYAPGE